MKFKVNDFQINKLLRKPFSKYEKFHHASKLKKFEKEKSPSEWPKEFKTTYFKEYPRLDKIILPTPKANKTPLETLLKNIGSKRSFSKHGLSLQQLSNLLYYSAGLKGSKRLHQGKRFYPSAGARYPLEVYLISLKGDLLPGIYHYSVKSHSLEILLDNQKIQLAVFFNLKWINKWVSNSSAIILISGAFPRTTSKYGDRGYRHVLVEAGHLAQNIYLNCAALKLSCCAIGGYVDDELNKLLDIDGTSESIIYVLATSN